MDIYVRSIQAVAADSSIDAVAIIGAGLGDEANRLFTEAILKTRRDTGKVILMVNLPGFDPAYIPQFCNAGIPYFESSERAFRTYARIRRYQQWRAERL
jgi:acyl-CoA synthetase (NDP forming)